MRQYHELMERILREGVEKHDRTGTGTRSVFGHQMRFDLVARLSARHHQEAAPEIDRARVALVSRRRHQRQVPERSRRPIWDEWADERGELGPVYGSQWRSWPAKDGGTIDQIAHVVDMIKKQSGLAPADRHRVESRRGRQDGAAAVPLLFQFYVAEGRLSCQLYQRSADIFLGVPFNIASYALLTLMVAQVTGLKPGDFVHTLGDAHLYLNHLEQAHLQLSRAPKALPVMKLNPAVKDLSAFRYEDFTLEGYEPHPHIKAEVAV